MRHTSCAVALAVTVFCSPILAADSSAIRINPWMHSATGQQETLAAPRPASDAAKILREQILAHANKHAVSAQTVKAPGGARTMDASPRRAGRGTPLMMSGDGIDRGRISALNVSGADRDLAVARDFLR